MSDSFKYQEKALEIVSLRVNQEVSKLADEAGLPPFLPGDTVPSDFYIVWFAKTLQNWKALISTDLVNTGIYFEVTYNGDRCEAYVDWYEKHSNATISDVDWLDATTYTHITD